MPVVEVLPLAEGLDCNERSEERDEKRSDEQKIVSNTGGGWNATFASLQLSVLGSSSSLTFNIVLA